DVEPKEGIDKLIEFLERDAVSSSDLEVLKKQLEQLLEKQDAGIEVLERIDDSLQQTPTVSNLLTLYTLQKKQLEKQEAHVQVLKRILGLLRPTSSDLQELRKEVVHASQAIHEQQKEISKDLVKLLEQLKFLALPSDQESQPLFHG